MTVDQLIAALRRLVMEAAVRILAALALLDAHMLLVPSGSEWL